MPYCASRFRSIRRRTAEVRAGAVGIGGGNPVRVQSMTTTDTRDIAATVAQCVRLAEAGCELVRVTAPNVEAARTLRDIRRGFDAAGFARVPLVADIHFLPAAAMEAVGHVEKVRVNPGNYADKKKPAARAYSDSEYADGLARVHDAFSPLVLRAKTLGRALRVGVNHGSLSDRILNRFGDTPAGMVESALEFARVCENHGFRNLVFSMKASNPRVMIQATRLLAARMAEENMRYPLHLGVTEAGGGEDGRIKSAIGIGALLCDGLGDTLRVSLTEDPWHEIPVARELAARAETLWQLTRCYEAFGFPDDYYEFEDIHYEKPPEDADDDHIPKLKANAPERGSHEWYPDPLRGSDGSLASQGFHRRKCATVRLSPDCGAGGPNVPRVIVPATLPLNTANLDAIAAELRATHAAHRDIRAEGLLVRVETAAGFSLLPKLAAKLEGETNALFAEADGISARTIDKDFAWRSPIRLVVVSGLREKGSREEIMCRLEETREARRRGKKVPDKPSREDSENEVGSWTAFVLKHNCVLAVDNCPELQAHPVNLPPENLLFTLSAATHEYVFGHPLGFYRALAEGSPVQDKNFGEQRIHANAPFPIWIRNTASNSIGTGGASSISEAEVRLLESSILTGALLCDGIGDLVSIEDAPSQAQSLRLAYDILQGARARVSKTEYIACPSCGRTLFDIQRATAEIQAATGHLRGVTIAIMGCIVNGPGEMADADFGYVGGAPGKINLYVGKTCVQYNIPQSDAGARLIALIKQHGKWHDPVSP
jgi:(E)-4-hydroxy-3-methylbut-2-enyl-diphosphate synthase